MESFEEVWLLIVGKKRSPFEKSRGQIPWAYLDGCKVYWKGNISFLATSCLLVGRNYMWPAGSPRLSVYYGKCSKMEEVITRSIQTMRLNNDILIIVACAEPI